MAQIVERNYLDDYLIPVLQGGLGVADHIADYIITEQRPYSSSELRDAIQSDSSLSSPTKNAFNTNEAINFIIDAMTSGVWGIVNSREFARVGQGQVSSYSRPELPIANAGPNQLNQPGTQVTLQGNPPDSSQGQSGWWLVVPQGNGNVLACSFSNRNLYNSTFTGQSTRSYILVWALTESDGQTMKSVDNCMVSFQ